MSITTEDIKLLRESTGAGVLDCKKALTETDGDMDAAIGILRKKGLAAAAKKANREANDGLIAALMSDDGKSAVMVEVNCETDFVAKTDDFQDFAKDIAMHIAAMNPVAVKREDIPEQLVAREAEIYKKQAMDSGKPENIAEKMVSGKLDKFFSEVSLLEQKFVKNPDLSIQDLLNDLIAKMGENITVKRFVRFQVGADA